MSHPTETTSFKRFKILTKLFLNNNILKHNTTKTNVDHVLNFSVYFPKHTLHTDLLIPNIKQVAIDHYDIFQSQTILHPNPIIWSLPTPQLPDNPNLRRQWSRDLLKQPIL